MISGGARCSPNTHLYIQDVWPEAIRIRNLLKGAKVEMDDLAALSQPSDRPKRSVDEALGADRNTEVLQPHLYGPSSSTSANMPPSHSSFNPYSSSSLHAPQSAMSYIPGYEWWPQLIGPASGPSSYAQEYGFGQQQQQQQPSTSLESGHSMLPFTFDQSQLSSDFLQGVSGSSMSQSHQGQQQQQQSGTPGGDGSHRHYGQGYPPP